MPVEPSTMASLKKGTTEQILAKIPKEKADRFELFWQKYCKFCKDRGANSGAKKPAAIAWVDLVKTNFRGQGIEAFEKGSLLFKKRQGDKTSGIPHGCRFLYTAQKGSGAWEDMLEQERASTFATPAATEQRGVNRLFVAQPSVEVSPEERAAMVKRMREASKRKTQSA